MGCDIHFFTERFTSSNNYQGPRDLSEDRNTKIEEILEGRPVTERWVSADDWTVDTTRDKQGSLLDGSMDWEHSEKYWGRNYYLFSIF